MSDSFEQKARDLENSLRGEMLDKESRPLIKDTIVKGQPDVIFPSLENEDINKDVEEEKQKEPEPEESPEDEEEEEVEIKPKKRHYSLKSQLQEIQRDKHRALEEANQYKQYAELYNKAIQENEQLKRYLDTTEKGMLYTKQENIANRINEARRKKEEARVTGDVSAETTADIELQLSLRELDRFNEIAARVPGYQYNQQQPAQNPYQQPYQPQYYPQQEQYQPQQSYTQPYVQPQVNFHPDSIYNSQNWDRNNQWNDRNSPEYDEDFSRQFNESVNRYNYDLYQKGQAGQIGSAEYFHRIQEWVDENRPVKNNLSLNKSNRHVAPASSSGRGGRAANYNDYELTEGQKSMAQSLNMTEDEFRPFAAKTSGKWRGAK